MHMNASEREIRRRLDIIVPVYNEEDTVAGFFSRLAAVLTKLPYQWRVIFVDDGSDDKTFEYLTALAEPAPELIVLKLSRNFGHQAALSAGIDTADADWVLMMDGDGQHPPELISELLALGEGGYDIVITQRVGGVQPGWLKRTTSSLFYRFMNALTETELVQDSSDFRLMNRKALDALRSMPEYHRFLRGMVAWMGFNTVILPYTPEERIGGSSKYSLRKMIKLAMDATFSFSLTPMYVSLVMGCGFLFLALVEVVYVLSFWFSGAQSTLEPGWSSLMFMLLMVGGTLLVMLGITGIYVGYILQEVKHRPVYILGDVYSHDSGDVDDRNTKE